MDFGLERGDAAVRDAAQNGAPGLHFYTINQAEPTLRLWKNLGLGVRA